MTLTEETGVVPPLSHTWTAPLVEDMLHYARTGIVKAMVMGPGKAVLFLWETFLGRGPESRQVRGILQIHVYMGRHLGW